MKLIANYYLICFKFRENCIKGYKSKTKKMVYWWISEGAEGCKDGGRPTGTFK